MNARTRRPRKGSVLVIALVCLVIVIGLLGGLFQGTLRARRQLHAERDRRQTEWILQAGVSRASVRWAQEADYRGETWMLPADAIVGTGEGLVTIQATRDSEHQLWKLYVVAEYPRGSELSIRRSRTILVPSME